MRQMWDITRLDRAFAVAEEEMMIVELRDYECPIGTGKCVVAAGVEN